MRLAALVLWVLREVPHTPRVLVRPGEVPGDPWVSWLAEEAADVGARGAREVEEWLELRSEGTYRAIAGPFDLGDHRNFETAEGELRRLLEDEGETMATRKARKRSGRKAEADTQEDAGRADPDLADPIALQDAVGLTGWNERTLRRHVERGNIRAKRKGGRVWLERADVERVALPPGGDTNKPGQARSGSLLPALLAESKAEQRALLSEVLQLSAAQREQTTQWSALEADRERHAQDRERQAEELRRQLTDAKVQAVRDLAELERSLAVARRGYQWALAFALVAGAVAVALAVWGVR